MPAATKHNSKPSLIKKIVNHPTIFMLNSFFNLSFSSKNQVKKIQTKPLAKRMLYPVFLLLGLAASFYLLSLVIDSNTFKKVFSTDETQASSIQSINNDETSHSLDDFPLNKGHSNPPITESKNRAPIWSDADLVSKGTETQTFEETIQEDNQRVEKLVQLLVIEQQKTQALNQKLNNQDKQLKELLANTDINIKDQKYITAITQNKENSTLDEKKIQEVDYYNKVQVLLKGNLTSQTSNRQDHQIQKIVALLLKENRIEENTKIESEYTKSLDKESAVRSNEVRSIAIKKNETLWSMAVRAYGSGILYKKIMKANPQITEENAYYLQPGTLIRVPM